MSSFVRLSSSSTLSVICGSSCGFCNSVATWSIAVFNAVSASYGYLSPELWKPTVFSKAPFQEHTDFLAKEAESAKADAAY